MRGEFTRNSSHDQSRRGHRRSPPAFPVCLSLAPGLALTAAIAGVAFALRLVPGVATLSPMILAVLLGVVLHNSVGAPAAAREGVAFSLRRVLRFSIILLGLQITAGQAAELGVGGLAEIAAALLSTLAFTILMGRALGVSRGLALLIGVGTSICGASAVLAAKVATAGDDEDAAYAVACVTVFGTLAMFAYPLARELSASVAARLRPVGRLVDPRNRPGRRGGVPGRRRRRAIRNHRQADPRRDDGAGRHRARRNERAARSRGRRRAAPAAVPLVPDRLPRAGRPQQPGRHSPRDRRADRRRRDLPAVDGDGGDGASHRSPAHSLARPAGRWRSGFSPRCSSAASVW